jgi:octaprenyl-diphosphate synthase
MANYFARFTGLLIAMTSLLDTFSVSCIQNDYQIFLDRLKTPIEETSDLIQPISQHLFARGGKHIRPLMAMLACRALDYTGSQHIDLALILEQLHTATLLHDDVVDESEKRRGVIAAHQLWSNKSSILVGDYLIATALNGMIALEIPEALKVLAEGTRVIALGEVLQLTQSRKPSLDINGYFNIIEKKTAKLFEVATECASIIAQADTFQRNAMKKFGYHFGTCFQIMDDLLDYTTSNRGKNAGEDFTEAKMTLPLILTLEELDSADKAQMLHWLALEDPTIRQQAFNDALILIKKTNALDRTQAQAKAQAQKAIETILPLGLNPFTQALIAFADQASIRSH